MRAKAGNQPNGMNSRGAVFCVEKARIFMKPDVGVIRGAAAKRYEGFDCNGWWQDARIHQPARRPERRDVQHR